jgi:nitrite reductase/ring-hydroxylating ferredoxin subunit/uncharacterized membrane protein
VEPNLRNVTAGIGRLEGLDRVGDPLADALKRVLKPGAVKDLLSGTWLGHPLHPVLTDIPIGAWTSAAFLDLFGGKKARPAADALVRLGILTAVPTAVTGISDWVDTVEKERRVGVAHAAGNVTALTFFLRSSRARRKGKRMRGGLLGLLGLAAATAAAYLGGHLSFGRGVGVDQTVFESPPTDWTAVMEADALSEHKPHVVNLDGGVDVLLYRKNGRILGISNRCNHKSCPLSDGDFDDEVVTCPCHGSRFRLDGGGVVRGPATAPQPTYDVREREGKIELKLRNGE